MSIHTRWPVLALSMALLASACGDAAEVPEKIIVRGTLGPDYVIGEPMSSSGLINVQAVVAVPHAKGEITPELLAQAHVHPLTSAEFEIELETDTNWVLLLVESLDSLPEDRIAGYMALGHSDGSGLVNLPATSATGDIHLGYLSEQGLNALSLGRIDEESGTFLLSRDTLVDMAAMDDAYQSLSNYYLNSDGEMYYRPEQYFEWRAPLESIEQASPAMYRFRGFQLRVDTNDSRPGDAYNDICTGDTELKLTLPGTLHSETGTLYSSENPLRNDAPLEGDELGCIAGDIAVSHQEEDLRLEFPANDFFTQVNQGPWRIELAGERLATFDLKRAFPTDEFTRSSKIPIPIPTLTAQRSPLSLLVDVDWYLYDSAVDDYRKVQGTRSLEELVNASSVTLESVGGDTQSQSFDTAEQAVVTQAIFEDWTRGAGSEDDELADLAIEMRLAGHTYRFRWTNRPYCGNSRVDEGELCDGDDHGGQSCIAMGFGGGEFACDDLCQADTDSCNPAFTGSWSSTGSMAEPRVGMHAFLLDDGRVLVFGGGPTTSEIWEPSTGQFALSASMGAARTNSHSIRLADGRILVTGGSVGQASASTSTEIWDPQTETFGPGPDMLVPRASHSAALRADGTVLISGGVNAEGDALDSVEVLDVDAENSVLLDDTFFYPRYHHSSLSLDDGRVLIIGGLEVFPVPGGGAAAKHAPGIVEVAGDGTTLESWPFEDGAGQLDKGRAYHTTTLLADGRILVTGGETEQVGLFDFGPTTTAEVLDPVTRTVAQAPEVMQVKRMLHTATRFNSGHVLLVGGRHDESLVDLCGPCREGEVFYPLPSHFAPAASMEHTRTSHAAVLLSGGSQLLVIGGANRLEAVADAYLFTK